MSESETSRPTFHRPIRCAGQGDRVLGTSTRREIVRMVARLSASERLIWVGLGGEVPRWLQRAFERTCRAEALDELNLKQERRYDIG